MHPIHPILYIVNSLTELRVDGFLFSNKISHNLALNSLLLDEGLRLAEVLEHVACIEVVVVSKRNLDDPSNWNYRCCNHLTFPLPLEW